MKKYLTGLIIISLFIFSGCSGKKEAQGEKQPEVQPPKQEEIQNNNQKPEEPANEQAGESKINQFPEASQGKFTDLAIKFNDTREKVLRELGEPEEITTWQGAELYIYDNLGIYLDPSEEKVTGLTAGEGYKTYGIQIGMKAEDIKNILGTPDFEGDNFESGAYVLEYEAGEYVVEVALDPQTKVSLGITLYSYNY